MQTKKKNIFLILLFLFGGALLCLLFALTARNSSNRNLSLKVNAEVARPKISATTPEAQALVNKHLWFASKQQDITTEKIQIENQAHAPELENKAFQKNDSRYHTDGLDHSPDRFDESVYQDLNRDPKEYNLSNPDQIVQRQLFDADALAEMNAAAREEYAQQFLANARAHGYEVHLSPEYVVLSVKRVKPSIRQPSLSNGFSRPQAH